MFVTEKYVVGTTSGGNLVSIQEEEPAHLVIHQHSPYYAADGELVIHDAPPHKRSRQVELEDRRAY